MSDKINYSKEYDISSPILQDIIPERLIKVYPYELPNASKSETFIENGAISIATISQSNFNGVTDGLKTEQHTYINEQGNSITDTVYYFEMFSATTSEGKLDLSITTSTLGKELKEEDRFSCLSNWYYETELDKLQIGNLRFLPAVFSIGKPFDKDEYEAGNQTMFIASTMISAKESQGNLSGNNINPRGLYEFMLYNITTIEKSENLSQIYFDDRVNTAGKLQVVSNGVTHNGVRMHFDNTSLISKVMGKGKNKNGDLNNIDFKLNDTFTPIKITPISTQDKVTILSDWFDTDLVLPYYISSKMLKNNTTTLDKLIIDDLSRHVLEDMLAITYAYTTQFSDFERYTTQDVAADSKLSGSDVGKIKSQFTIGYNGIPLTTMENKNAIEMIDTVFERFAREVDEDNENFKIIKLFIVGLSRYIYSNYAIGKGQNSFNRAFLPWYIAPDDTTPIKISLDKSGINYVLDENIKLRIKSKWFDIKDDDIYIKQETNISDLLMIQTDRKITMPELPYQISPINKSLNPGDININSSSSLSYMFYLPIKDKEKMHKLFLTNSSQNTNNQNQKITVTTDETNWGKTIKVSDLDKILIKKAAKDQGLGTSPSDLAKINYNHDGTINPIWGNFHKLPQRTSAGYIQFQYIDGQWFNTGQSSDVLAQQELIEKLDARYPNGYEIQNVHFGKNGSDHIVTDFEIRFVREYATGTYQFSGKNVVINFTDRNVLFDKTSWKNYLIDNGLTTNSQTPYIFKTDDDKEITHLDELLIYNIWGNEIKLDLNYTHFNLKCFNTTDETIGVQKIIFT